MNNSCFSSFFFFFCFVVLSFVLSCCLLTSGKNLKKTENKKKKKLPHTLSPNTHTHTVFLFASVCLSAFYHDNVDLIQIPWSSRNCHQLWWLNMTRLPDWVGLCVSACLSLNTHRGTEVEVLLLTGKDHEHFFVTVFVLLLVLSCRLYIFLL